MQHHICIVSFLFDMLYSHYVHIIMILHQYYDCIRYALLIVNDIMLLQFGYKLYYCIDFILYSCCLYFEFMLYYFFFNIIFALHVHCQTYGMQCCNNIVRNQIFNINLMFYSCYLCIIGYICYNHIFSTLYFHCIYVVEGR